MTDRDLDEKPYSEDEKRVAAWFFKHGIGGGSDPIGALIASHELMAAQRRQAMDVLIELVKKTPYLPTETGLSLQVDFEMIKRMQDAVRAWVTS